MALDGHLAEHQHLLLGLHIRRLAEIDRDLAEIKAAIRAAMRPFVAQQACLATIPGVDELTAASIIAEIGVDMAAFGTAQRLAAWAELANKVPSAKPMEGQRRVALRGQPRERGQAEAARHPQRQYVPQSDAGDRGGLGVAGQGHLPARQVPSPQGTDGHEEGRHGGGPQDPGCRLPQAPARRYLRRPRRRLARPCQQAQHGEAPGPARLATTSCFNPKPQPDPLP